MNNLESKLAEIQARLDEKCSCRVCSSRYCDLDVYKVKQYPTDIKLLLEICRVQSEALEFYADQHAINEMYVESAPNDKELNYNEKMELLTEIARQARADVNKLIGGS